MKRKSKQKSQQEPPPVPMPAPKDAAEKKSSHKSVGQSLPHSSLAPSHIPEPRRSQISILNDGNWFDYLKSTLDVMFGTVMIGDGDNLKKMYDNISDVVTFRNYTNKMRVKQGTPGDDMDFALDDADEFRMGENCTCVGMNTFMTTLDNRVFKHLTMVFSKDYGPMDRYIVVHAPDGWGKTYCTRLFCKKYGINYIQINPYQVKANIIYDTVKFACATGLPTIILLNNAHTWLAQDQAVYMTGGLHQTRLMTAPFLPDFLHTVHHGDLLKESHLVWFVLATEIEPTCFYNDFRCLPGIAYCEAKTPLSHDEIREIVRQTFMDRLCHIRVEAMPVSDQVIDSWIQTFQNFSPRAIHQECLNVIRSMTRKVPIMDVARIIATSRDINDNSSHDDLLREQENKRLAITVRNHLAFSAPDFLYNIAQRNGGAEHAGRPGSEHAIHPGAETGGRIVTDHASRMSRDSMGRIDQRTDLITTIYGRGGGTDHAGRTDDGMQNNGPFAQANNGHLPPHGSAQVLSSAPVPIVASSGQGTRTAHAPAPPKPKSTAGSLASIFQRPYSIFSGMVDGEVEEGRDGHDEDNNNDDDDF